MAKNKASAAVSADLKGKTAVVTGANAGIGKVTALELARAGARVILACRSEERGKAAIADIEAAVPGAAVELLRLDLGDLAQVRVAAAELLERAPRIDILVNNAGLGGSKGLTKDGFELTFGTNHIGPYLFTRLLIDRVAASAPARIVNLASKAHYRTGAIDYGSVRKETASATGMAEYCASKLANVLFSRELARRLEGRGVDVYAVHPGVVATDIWREVPAPLRAVVKLFMLSNEEGARTSLYCAADAGAKGRTGLYWDSSKPRQPSKQALDDAAAAELWRRTAEWVGLQP